MIMEAQAVVLDLEGTLADPEAAQFLAHKKALGEAEIALDEATYFAHGSYRRSRDFYRFLLRRAGRDMNHRSFEGFYREVHGAKKIYLLEAIGPATIVPMEGAREFLEYATREQLTIALATNVDRATMKSIVGAVQLAEYIHIAVTSDDVRKIKPSPEMYLLASRTIDVPPGECVAIEDSQAGLKAAKRAGMRCIVVPSRYTRGQDFSNADLIVGSLRDAAREGIVRNPKRPHSP